MHVIFDPDELVFEDFYQTGSGGMAYFMGHEPFTRGYGGYTIRQRGAGVGSVVRGLMKFLLPMVKSAGKAVGKEGLAVGQRIISDVTGGANLKDSVVTETTQAMKNLIDKAKTKMQRGSGCSRKGRILKKPISLNKKHLIGRRVSRRAVLKKKREDSLGFY